MTALRIDIGLELPVVKLLQGTTMNGLASLALEQHRSSATTVVPSEPAPMPKPVNVTDPRRGASEVGHGGFTPPSREAAASEIIVAPATVPCQPASTLGEPAGGPESGEQPQWSGAQRLARFGLTLALRASSRVTVDGIDRLPSHGAAILAVNHLSAIDVPLAFAILPRPAIMLAKDDLRRWRIVDWLLSISATPST